MAAIKSTIVLCLIGLALGAPDGKDFLSQPSPVYGRPSEGFLSDQPISAPEASVPAPTKPAPVANIRPVEPQPIYGAPNDQSVGYGESYGVQPYNQDPYNAGYGVQTGYEGYLVPADQYNYPLATSDGIGSLGYLWSLLPHTATVVAFVGKATKVLFSGAAVVAVGAAIVFAFCTFTPFCHITLAGWNPQTIKDEVRAYMTPDKISTVARFVRDAIQKYQEMQKTGAKKN